MQSGSMPNYMQAAGYGAGMSNPEGFMQATGAGGFGAGLAQMFFPGKNPYDKASPYFNQVPGIAQNAYQPYIGAGQQSMGQLQGQYGQLMNDPGGRMNQIGQSFHESPGYQWQLQQGLGAANNAAASGGMLGSGQHQQMAAQTASGLANQDYYNYLGNALGMYGQGLQGAQGMMGQGYNASGNLANALMGNAQNQGAMAYANQADQNKSQQQMWGDIFGGLGMLAFA